MIIQYNNETVAKSSQSNNYLDQPQKLVYCLGNEMVQKIFFGNYII